MAHAALEALRVDAGDGAPGRVAVPERAEVHGLLAVRVRGEARAGDSRGGEVCAETLGDASHVAGELREHERGARALHGVE